MDSMNPEEMSEAARLLAGLVGEWSRVEISGLPGTLKLDQIEVMPDLFQPREMSEKHISDLKKAIKACSVVDPVTMLRVGERSILIDGHHRREAYRLGKAESIPVVWFSGTPQEAVLEAGTMNSKAKLPMTNAERQDYAWRLVLIPGYSKAQTAEASGASKSQVAAMRIVRKDLGAAAASYETWGQARMASQGQPVDMNERDREVWMQEKADRWADRMAGEFSTEMARHPEVAAMALATYFGRKLGAVVAELRDHLPKETDDEEF